MDNSIGKYQIQVIVSWYLSRNVSGFDDIPPQIKYWIQSEENKAGKRFVFNKLLSGINGLNEQLSRSFNLIHEFPSMQISTYENWIKCNNMYSLKYEIMNKLHQELNNLFVLELYNISTTDKHSLFHPIFVSHVVAYGSNSHII